MHPERASFLAGHLLEERLAFQMLRRGAPDISFAAPKFNETTNVPEKLRTPPISISLTETSAPYYPRHVGETNDGRDRGTPQILEHAIFTV